MALKLRPGFSITVPGVRIIDVSKPEWLEYIQKTNFDNYQKGPMFRGLMVDLFGDGILVTDGALWKRARTVTSRVFSANTFKNVIEPSADHSVDGLLQVLQSSSDESRDLDFCNLFTRFTLDSFVKMTFGRALGLYGEESTTDTEPEACYKHLSSPEAFAEAFEFSQKQMDFRFTVMTGWELYEKVNLSVGQQMKRSCGTIHEYAYTLIDERLSKISSDDDFTNGETFQNDFLGLMMAVHRQRGHTLNREELKDAALSFLLAGRDATAQSLSWCFFHLLMNKEVISKIREEAAQLLGTYPSHQGRVTHDNYKQFTYTYAAVLETIRLHPPVPKNLKFAKADDLIPGGPTVEAGDCVTWSDWQMARDPEIWGADCGQYKPDRWIDEAGKIQNFGNFKFHAFNAGPRLCLGMNMAIFFNVKTIVEMLQNFDLEFSEGWLENVPKSEVLEGIKADYPTPQYQPSLTLPMKNAMMISVKPRLTQDLTIVS
ncbi:Protein kinase alk2 [Puccinia graminis f. sp. tritici]|uniref:Protein kinase alk2 n=2 Tax=Puccinia graminis f. sp. tritici TaxID=56615 RepID=A0A5B0PTI1_PUCGR|nr:Protein kinase alk2 [Puccinia graminis f. sp. tritici]